MDQCGAVLKDNSGGDKSSTDFAKGPHSRSGEKGAKGEHHQQWSHFMLGQARS